MFQSRQPRQPSKKSPRPGSEACIPITRREETLMRGHKRANTEKVGSSCFAHSSCPRGAIEILPKLICENLLQEASTVFPEVHLSSPRSKQILNSDVAPMQRFSRKVMPFLPLRACSGAGPHARRASATCDCTSTGDARRVTPVTHGATCPSTTAQEVEGDTTAVTAENRLLFVTSRGRMKMSREEAYELGGETSPRFVVSRPRRVPCTGEHEKESERWVKTSQHYWVCFNLCISSFVCLVCLCCVSSNTRPIIK